MTQSTTSRWKRLTKVFLALLWIPIAGECFLRLLHPVPVVPRYVTAGSFGIRVNEPNRSYWHSSADFRIQIRTNAQGMRADRDIPYEKPMGVKRIVVLGDSYSMGYEVSLEESFTYHMEQKLRDAGVNAEVVNLSVSGHGNAEQLLMLQHEGLKYSPDLVLVCWNSTDPDDNVRCGLYVLQDGTVRRANKEFLPGVAIQQRLYGIPGYEWVAANSNLYSFTREWLSWHVVKKVMVFVASTREAPTPTSAPATAPAEVPAAEPYANSLTIALLHELQKTSGNAGSKFLILDIPVRNTEHHFISMLPDRAMQPETGLPILSPITDFKLRMDRPLYWSRSQGHFTPHGCEVVADSLARHIIAGSLLAPAVSQ